MLAVSGGRLQGFGLQAPVGKVHADGTEAQVATMLPPGAYPGRHTALQLAPLGVDTLLQLPRSKPAASCGGPAHGFSWQTAVGTTDQDPPAEQVAFNEPDAKYDVAGLHRTAQELLEEKFVPHEPTRAFGGRANKFTHSGRHAAVGAENCPAVHTIVSVPVADTA